MKRQNLVEAMESGNIKLLKSHVWCGHCKQPIAYPTVHRPEGDTCVIITLDPETVHAIESNASSKLRIVPKP